MTLETSIMFLSFPPQKKSHSIKELDRLNIEGKLITRRTELQEVPWK
jgi:hypothetical protein